MTFVFSGLSAKRPLCAVGFGRDSFRVRGGVRVRGVVEGDFRIRVGVRDRVVVGDRARTNVRTRL